MGVSGRGPGLLARGPWDAGRVSANWSEEPFAADAAAEAEADAAIAELRERGSPTHDGLGARLASFSADGGELALELEPARWALRLGEDALDSMSALCVVRDREGRWLAGRRAEWVATWAGRWALGAGGAVDLGENPAHTLARELQEEWSVQAERLTVEALVRLPTGLILLVGMARLPEGAQVTIDPEHDVHAWWPADPADWPPEADPPLRMMAGTLAQPS
jgi:ADP-ribose pyrophosphatase YjhB (NUDIX family)